MNSVKNWDLKNFHIKKNESLEASKLIFSINFQHQIIGPP